MFKFLRRRRIKREAKLEDIYAAASFVQPILNRMENLLPFNQYSVRPFVLAILANEVLLNKRRSYIEFGAGISTILLAKFASISRLDLKITAVDHDAAWIAYLKEVLDQEALQSKVKLIHSPLRSKESVFPDTIWYDTISLLSQIREDNFDLVFVDGPPGRGKHHRYTALPFLLDNNLLSIHHSIYLDDAGRNSEKEIMRKWETLTGKKFETILGHLGASVPSDSMKVRLSN